LPSAQPDAILPLLTSIFPIGSIFRRMHAAL